MSHFFTDSFGNIWCTPINWGSPPRSFATVRVETKEHRYTRFSGRTLTHQFELEDGEMAPEWIEDLRVSPETWGTDPQEAA